MKNLKLLYALIGPATSAAGAVSGIRAARRGNDRLALANGLAYVLVAVTGAALAIRDMRKDGAR